MLGQTLCNTFAAMQYTTSSPSTTPGTSITAGSGSKGSWGQIASALSYDVYGFYLWVVAGNSSGNQRDYLIDIGADPAGGTTYTTMSLIGNLYSPQDSNGVDSGRWYYVPMYIPAAATVGARAQGNGANTVRVAGKFYQRPSAPEYLCIGQYSESIGVSGNAGTAVTPGNSGAEGSWVSLGTTTRPCWYWILGCGFAGSTTTAQMYYVDLATGDASNKHMIIENFPLFNPGTTEKTGSIVFPAEAYYDIGASATIYCRASASGTTDSGFCAMVVGIGG